MGFFVAGITKNWAEAIGKMKWRDEPTINTRPNLVFHLGPEIQVVKSKMLKKKPNQKQTNKKKPSQKTKKTTFFLKRSMGQPKL